MTSQHDIEFARGVHEMLLDITFGTYAEGGEAAGVQLADYDRQGLRIGIFGASGSGKGWLLGLTLEQCVALHLPVIAIDPESELWTLQEIGALVLGGPHADAPIPASVPGVRAVMQFAIETGTPVVFDLGKAVEDAARRRPSEMLREGERLMGIFDGMADDLRTRVVFAVTEAELFAPQQVPRTGLQPEMLAAIQKRGRKRGVIPIIETQRTADIAKSVISQCNKRFIGHLDEPLDFDNIKRHVAPWTFAQIRALDTGHFVATPESEEVVVGPRSVTHGGGTPLSGEVRLQRRATSAELTTMLERLRVPEQDFSEDEEPAPPSGRRRAVQPEAGGALLTKEDYQKYTRQEQRIAEAEQRAGAAVARVAVLEQESLRTASEMEDLRRAAAAAETEHDILTDLRLTLARLLGEAMPTPIAQINMPDGTTMATNGVTRDEVLDLIRRNALSGSGSVTVEPVEALRTRYLEAAAQRLYDTVNGLDADEREVVLFLLAHPTFHTINAVQKGVSGSDGGSGRKRWEDAILGAVRAGLVVVGGSGRGGRKENIDAWVRNALAPHDPTDEDVQRVRQRVLSLLATSAPS